MLLLRLRPKPFNDGGGDLPADGPDNHRDAGAGLAGAGRRNSQHDLIHDRSLAQRNSKHELGLACGVDCGVDAACSIPKPRHHAATDALRQATSSFCGGVSPAAPRRPLHPWARSGSASGRKRTAALCLLVRPQPFATRAVSSRPPQCSSARTGHTPQRRTHPGRSRSAKANPGSR